MGRRRTPPLTASLSCNIRYSFVLTNAEANVEAQCEEERYRHLPRDQENDILLYEGG